MAISDDDLERLRRCVELAREALDDGDEPFGSILVDGDGVTLYEDRSRVNYFMEIFRFRDEAEFTAFDDKFHKDRKIAAIYALLDDIVEAEKSDFKIFERRL